MSFRSSLSVLSPTVHLDTEPTFFISHMSQPVSPTASYFSLFFSPPTCSFFSRSSYLIGHFVPHRPRYYRDNSRTKRRAAGLAQWRISAGCSSSSLPFPQFSRALASSSCPPRVFFFFTLHRFLSRTRERSDRARSLRPFLASLLDACARSSGTYNPDVFRPRSRLFSLEGLLSP